MDEEREVARPADWRAHLDLAAEYWRRAREGRPGLVQLADREWRAAMDRVPPDPAAHTPVIEVATRYGQLDELKALYASRESEWPFAAGLLAQIRAIEAAQAAGRAMPLRSKHAGDWLQFGTFVFGATDVLIWWAKRTFGSRGPLLIAVALLAMMLWLNWPFLREMVALWRAY